jgi:hypothetical protein
MNPQFSRTQADRNAIRNEYIKNLQLETANNLTNYNANQIFKQTGALPPSITAQLDTRSITEKYADKQKARVAVIAGLREITDGANANMISDQIHGDELITLLNNLPQIVADIKPKWSLGITAPAFMNYWNNYKQALTANAGVSNYPIIQSNQLLTSINGALQNIQATLPTGADYDKLKQVINLLPKTTKRGLAIKIIDDAKKQAEEIVAQANATAQQKIGESDPILQQKRIELLGELTARLPNITALSQLTQDAQIASQLDRNVEGADEVCDNVINILQPELQELQELKIVSERINEIEKRTPKSTPANTPQQSQEATEPIDWEEGSEGDDEEGMTTLPAFSPNPVRNPTSFADIFQNDLPYIKAQIDKLVKSKELNPADINYGAEYKGEKRYYSVGKKQYYNTNIPELVDNILQPKRGLGGAQESKQSETGKGLRKRHMKGCGVSFAPKGTISSYTKVDTSKKVEKVPSYIQFGKHLLHQHDLHGGILKIKRLSGTVINELPTQSIGGKLKKVLITLTGSGNPSFEDINELSEHEKSLLNKIVKNCKIDQRLLVPTPDKTKEEQFYNRLQILSGEIGAGNNNPQIVRELKTLLLKLKNSGRIPARHAHAILEELLSLGY